MQAPRRNLPVLAFCTSLCIHAMLLFVLPLAIDAATPEKDPANPDNAEQQVMTMPVELELGIDAPTPDSPTWIGHEEPKPQLAELAEVEQAAFTEQPVAAAPPPQEAITPLAEAQPVEAQPQPDQPMPTETLAQETPQETESAEQEPEPQPEEPKAEEPHPEESQPQPSIAPEEMTGETSVGDEPRIEELPRAIVQQQPPPDVEAIAEAVREVVQQVQRAIEEVINALPQRAPSEVPEASQPAPQPQPSQPPAPQPSPAPLPSEQPPQEQVAPQQQDAPRDDGTPADKESPPTSIIDVPREQWELGKPLARHGLLLKPRRPEFTLLTMITASPGNPLCVMHFDRQGIPVKAALLRSSGDKRVDDAVLASLYRWRAEGAELTKLNEGQTLPVQMRIVLNRRALQSEREQPPRTAQAE